MDVEAIEGKPFNSSNNKPIHKRTVKQLVKLFRKKGLANGNANAAAIDWLLRNPNNPNPNSDNNSVASNPSGPNGPSVNAQTINRLVKSQRMSKWHHFYAERNAWLQTPNARGWFSGKDGKIRLDYLTEFDCNKNPSECQDDENLYGLYNQAVTRFQDAKVLVEEAWSNVRSRLGFGPMRGNVSPNTKWGNINVSKLNTNTQKRIKKRVYSQMGGPTHFGLPTKPVSAPESYGGGKKHSKNTRGGKKGNRRRTRRNRK